MVEPLRDPSVAIQDVRPVVAQPSSNRSVWIFAAILLAIGGGMFYALQINRLSTQRSALTAPQPATPGLISSPPELEIPQVAPVGAMPTGAVSYPVYLGAMATPVAQAPVYRPQAPPLPYAAPSGPVGAGAPAYLPVQQSSGPAFAYQAPLQAIGATSDAATSAKSDGRVEARTFKNPATTVPQGAVLQAVMETALDSTRAGFARAILSRDVESFDGSHVLIPKGSRLFGEYQADVGLGQKRALIQWKRLTRPDGTIIDLDSPSADPLGRAGVKGKVNTHFFQRFSGAILQSLLDVGVRAASEKATGDTVIVGLPGSTTQATTIQNSADIKPTLKIPQGASVSVFVARDLDFTSVEP